MNETNEDEERPEDTEPIREGEQILREGEVFLSCDLTPEEYDEHSQELAKLVERQKELEATHKAMRAGMKEDADALKAELRRESEIVRNRSEERNVHCLYVGNLDENALYRVRTDTNERVISRALKDSERDRMLSIPLPLGRHADDPDDDVPRAL